MSAAPDHYRMLHVQPDAPAAIIHASYRTLVQRALGGNRQQRRDRAARRRLRVLGDPQRRAAYDLERLTGTRLTHARQADPTGARGTRSCLFCGTRARRSTARSSATTNAGSARARLYPAERHRLEYSGQRMLRRIPKRHAINSP